MLAGMHTSMWGPYKLLRTLCKCSFNCYEPCTFGVCNVYVRPRLKAAFTLSNVMFGIIFTKSLGVCLLVLFVGESPENFMELLCICNVSKWIFPVVICIVFIINLK